MATDRSHTGSAARVLAVTATLTAMLWAGCQASEPEPSQQPGPVSTAGQSGTVVPAAASQNTAGRAPVNTPSSGSAGTRPAAVSGSAGQPSAGQPNAGQPSAGQPSAGASGSTTGTAQAGNTAAGSTSEAAAGAAAPGTLPTVTDFKATGPFTPKREAGPSGYVLFYPQELGKDGAKHPILSWGPGAVETASDFSVLLNHIASHGFAAISFDGTPQGQELVTGIDWMLAENMRADSVFYQKLDETKISAGGHSAGSLATFVIGGDKRLVTTLHISGGTFDPHTDIENLHAPALFVCGEPGGDGLLMGDVANPNCEIDFMNATVPVFYGITKGAAHMTPTDIGDAALRTHQLGAMVGWLRWQLLGDSNAKNLFVGDTCLLCSDAAWGTAKSKNLN